MRALNCVADPKEVLCYACRELLKSVFSYDNISILTVHWVQGALQKGVGSCHSAGIIDTGQLMWSLPSRRSQFNS